MNFQAVLSDAWRLAWNTKWLWALGILAALVMPIMMPGFGWAQAQGGNGALWRQNQEGNWESTTPFAWLLIPLAAGASPSSGTAFQAVVSRLFAAFAPTLVVMSVIFLAAWVISLVARAGLVHATLVLDRREVIAFGPALRRGLACAGRVVGLKLLLNVPSIAALVGVGVLPVASSMPGNDWLEPVSLICLVSSACLSPFILILWLYLNAYAFRAAVLDDLPILASIGKAWRVFRANLGHSLLLGLVFATLGMLVSSVVSLLIRGVSAVLGLAGSPLGTQAALEYLNLAVTRFVAGEAVPPGTLATITLGLSVLLLCPWLLSAVLFSAFAVFQSASFTLAYLEFTGRRPATQTPPEPPAEPAPEASGQPPS